MDDKYICICRIPRKKKKVRIIVTNEREFNSHIKKDKNFINHFVAYMDSGFSMVAYIDARKQAQEFCKKNGYIISG